MTLFRQAKEAIQFRWGRKAKLVAGTCLAVALRESKRSDCLRDIAYLLEEPFSTLSRTFISVTGTLGLTLSRAESVSFIPILQQHFSSLMQDTSNSLPANLIQELSSISLHAVSNTATSLSNLLARIGAQSVIQHPTSSIACAIYMLSLESELRTTIKQLGLLAQVLGARLNVGKGAVMACYKAIQDVLASLADNVPWLDKYEAKNGRAKVARRNIVARATKDIITFYDDSWKKTRKPTFDIICDEGSQFDQQEISADDREECNVPPKKRKLVHKGKQAIQFLLDPVTGPIPKFESSPLETTAVCKPMPPQANGALLSYFLSTNATSRKPTRLQLLAAARGGADEISDDELFEDGELENLMRSEEEMKVIAHMYDWGRESDVPDEETRVSLRPRVSGEPKPAHQDVSLKGRRSRINLDALAKFLNDDDSKEDEPFTGLLDTDLDVSVDDSEASGDEPECDALPRPDNRLSSKTPGEFATDAAVIEDWRPPSPGNDITNEWYEVYD